MSHSVKIECKFKSFNALRKVFENTGWTIQQDTVAKTYFYDPSKNTVYPYVAVNPNTVGYDLGLRINPNGEIEVFGDFFDPSLAAQLGENLSYLKQQYSKQVIEDTYVNEGYAVVYENLKNGSVKVTLTK